MAFNSPILDLSSTKNDENRSIAPPIVPHNTSPSFLINDYTAATRSTTTTNNNSINNGPPSPSAAYHAFSTTEVYRGVYHHDAAPVMITNAGTGSINNNNTKDSFGIYSNNSINDNNNTNNNKSASGFDLDYVIKNTATLSVSDRSSSLPDSPSEPKGGYLEPMTHFGTDREPLLLFDDLKAILNDLIVDYETIPNKFKFRCVSYSGEHRHGNAAKFIIRIFSWPNDSVTDDETDPADNIPSNNNNHGNNNNNNNANNDEESEEEGRGYETEKLTKGKYAVEFQRREGDIFHFYEIFHATKDAMAAIPNHLENNNNSAAASSSGAFLSPHRATLKLTLSTPPPIPSAVINHDQLLSALKCLQQMCASDCVDVKIQAALALTDLTYNINDGAVLNTLINAKIVDDLFRCFLCSSEDVSRAALTGLANIVKLRADICEKISKENNILIKLKESSLSRTAEIVRESARIIDNLIQTMPVLIDHPAIADCLRILETSKITKASDIAKRIKATRR